MIEQLEMYPFAAGFKEPAGASKENAERQSKEVNNERRLNALRMLSNNPQGLTSDEVAELLDENILSIRPRISELRALGRIESTGKRRKSSNGNASTVWRVS